MHANEATVRSPAAVGSSPVVLLDRLHSAGQAEDVNWQIQTDARSPTRSFPGREERPKQKVYLQSGSTYVRPIPAVSLDW